jgi:hypothetical protein
LFGRRVTTALVIIRHTAHFAPILTERQILCLPSSFERYEAWLRRGGFYALTRLSRIMGEDRRAAQMRRHVITDCSTWRTSIGAPMWEPRF